MATLALNVAVMLWALFMVTVHDPVPEHPPPDQPEKVESDTEVAARVTEVPALNDALQVVPQLMLVGFEVMVPEPVPDLETERV